MSERDDSVPEKTYMYEVRFARNRVPGFFTDFEGSKSASKYSYTEIRYKTTLIITL